MWEEASSVAFSFYSNTYLCPSSSLPPLLFDSSSTSWLSYERLENEVYFWHRNNKTSRLKILYSTFRPWFVRCLPVYMSACLFACIYSFHNFSFFIIVFEMKTSRFWWTFAFHFLNQRLYNMFVILFIFCCFFSF